MKNLQLSQFQEMYLSGSFSDVVITVNSTSSGTLFNIAFVYSTEGYGLLISQKNAIRDFKTLDSCYRALFFVDSFKVEDEIHFMNRIKIK
jgi:hypothetical protein